MCILFEDDSVTFADFKSAGIPGYVNLCRATSPEAIAIEQVYSRTGQGVKSVFSFGQRFGELEGMLQTLSLPYTYCSPTTLAKVLRRSFQIWQAERLYSHLIPLS